MHYTVITSTGAHHYNARDLDEAVEDHRSSYSDDVYGGYADTAHPDKLTTLGYWGEHLDHPVADWQYEVASGTTRAGYWEWLVLKLDDDADPALQDEPEAPRPLTNVERHSFERSAFDRDRCTVCGNYPGATWHR